MKIGRRAKQPLINYVFSRHQFYKARFIVLFNLTGKKVAQVNFSIHVFSNVFSVTKEMSLGKIRFVVEAHLERKDNLKQWQLMSM